jgi:uncharacterized protein (DUF58 family)
MRGRERRDPPAGETPWPDGPRGAAVADLVRSLELTITRRLDGMLHGQHQGLTPGHGSEPGDGRDYQPGDDVRRIDWNVTARTQSLHVRDQIADRDLEAWLVVDASASMRFGTALAEKSSIALAAAGTIGFLSARSNNRVGAIVVQGPNLHILPPRVGRDQVRVLLQLIATSSDADGSGRADLESGLQRVGALARRRGFIAVIADLHSVDPDQWRHALGTLAQRHEVLVVDVVDPRELDLPDVGWVSMVDPATGTRRDVRITKKVRSQFAVAAEQRSNDVADAVNGAGATLLVLRTDEDWLGAIVTHVTRRRVQVARGTWRRAAAGGGIR